MHLLVLAIALLIRHLVVFGACDREPEARQERRVMSAVVLYDLGHPAVIQAEGRVVEKVQRHNQAEILRGISVSGPQAGVVSNFWRQYQRPSECCFISIIVISKLNPRTNGPIHSRVIICQFCSCLFLAADKLKAIAEPDDVNYRVPMIAPTVVKVNVTRPEESFNHDESRFSTDESINAALGFGERLVGCLAPLACGPNGDSYGSQCQSKEGDGAENHCPLGTKVRPTDVKISRIVVEGALIGIATVVSLVSLFGIVAWLLLKGAPTDDCAKKKPRTHEQVR